MFRMFFGKILATTWPRETLLGRVIDGDFGEWADAADAS
jgi:hypothetical protein